MANKPWRITSHIYEGEDPRPIVVHEFYGDTQEEAEGVYAAHMKSDQFFRECTTTGCFNKNVPCHAKAWIDRR